MLRTFISAPPMIPLITVLFTMVNGILFWKLGVSVDDDTYRFLGYADEIREQGFFFKPHEFWYIGYVLFLLLVTTIYDSLNAIVVVQVLLSYLAVISLYVSAKRLFNSIWSGLWAVSLFLGFFMISFWNFWVYAESLFISLNCLSLYFFIKWYKNEINLSESIFGGVIICLTILTKPTGIALLAAICILVIFFVMKKATTKPMKIAFFVLIFIGFLAVLNAMLKTFGFINDYRTGEIVYNISKLSHMEYAKWLIVSPPGDLYIPSQNYPPLLQLVVLMVLNPIYATKLFALKFFFFITGIRPYYSVWHNLYNLGILLPAYFLFAYNVIKKIIPQELVWFGLTFIIVTALSPTLLTIDWSGRFLLPMLPFIFLVGAGGRPTSALIPEWISGAQNEQYFSDKVML